MNRIAARVRDWFRSGGRRLAPVWPFRLVVHRLNCRHEADLADALLADLAALDEAVRANTYAEVTRTELSKHGRTISSLCANAAAAKAANRSGKLTPTARTRGRQRHLAQDVERLTLRDGGWRRRSASLREQRTELWEQATRWSPVWQKTITGLIAEVDSRLRFAMKARNPEEQLNHAARWVERLRGELGYVTEVRDVSVQIADVGARIERVKPLEGSYLAFDLRTFRDTAKAGDQLFAAGDYVAARRHFDTALVLAKRVLATERVDRLKRKKEARQWIQILGNRDEQARTVSTALSKIVDARADQDLYADWESLSKAIDDLVLARACEMGKRDQKYISRRIGVKRTVRWREKIEWDELARFAGAVAEDL